VNKKHLQKQKRLAMQFTAILWKYRPAADGLMPVKIRIADGKKSWYKMLDVRIKESDWNADREIVKMSHPQAGILNQIVVREKGIIETQYFQSVANGSPLTGDQLLQASNSKGDFYFFFEEYINDARKRGSYGKVRVDESMLRMMKLWRAELPIELLTVDTLRAYEEHMRAERENSDTTIAVHMSRIRAVVNRIMKKKLLPRDNDPFQNYQIKAGRVIKEGLSAEDVQKLHDVDLAGYPEREMARDAYLLSIYCAGMRWGDICTLKWESVQDGRLSYVMRKNGKPVNVILPEQAKAIIPWNKQRRLDGYIFKFIDPRITDPQKLDAAINVANACVSASLRRLATKLGITRKINFHTARHTFARWAKAKGIHVHTIMALLNHSDVRITQRYLDSLETSAADSAMDTIFPPPNAVMVDFDDFIGESPQTVIEACKEKWGPADYDKEGGVLSFAKISREDGKRNMQKLDFLLEQGVVRSHEMTSVPI
jgi:integrase